MRGRVEEEEAGRGGERGGATGKEKDKGRVGGRKTERERELDLQISLFWCIYIYTAALAALVWANEALNSLRAEPLSNQRSLQSTISFLLMQEYVLLLALPLGSLA